MAFTLLRLVLAALPANAPATPAAAARPSLLVVITVDQLAADHVDRFGGQFTGGLARLLAGGAVFSRACHDHAITETAPGHATLLSGRYPRSTGITANLFGVADPERPLLGARGDGASPRRFRGTTLVDWMVAADPRSRALSVSLKDRGAILPLGRAKQSVFWYSTDGEFTTSTYYADTLATWVRQFNARQLPRKTAGTAWTLLLPPDQYPEPDTVAQEAGGADNVFPHRIPADSAAAASYVRATPAGDAITLALALAGLEALRLGEGPAPDLLAVSLSATDYIGHRYGPDSREIHDQVLQVDRLLGRFLDSLYRLRDSATVAIALTSDHGIARLPELAGVTPGRVDLDSAVAEVGRWIVAQGGDADWIALDDGALLADRAALERRKIEPDSVAARFVALVRGAPGVHRADLLSALASADTVHDVIARRWLHMFPLRGYALAVVTLGPGNVWGHRTAAEHGTPNDYDVHVPLILYGPWFKPGRYDAPVRTVDLAPTLAAVLGVEPMERLDGVVLSGPVKP